MLPELQRCSDSELREQIAYLADSPVAVIAAHLQAGTLTLSKTVIRSLQQLGQLKTEFGAFGPLAPASTEGEMKFRVAELVSVLRANPTVDDGGLLRQIESRMELERRNEVQYNVTIWRQGTDLVVKDGNKRAVAFFENRRAHGNDVIEFPVFVVERNYKLV